MDEDRFAPSDEEVERILREGNKKARRTHFFWTFVPMAVMLGCFLGAWLLAKAIMNTLWP